MSFRPELFPFLLVLATLFDLVPAQKTAVLDAKETITVEWIYSDEGKRVAAVESYRWLNDNTALLYNRRLPGKEREIEISDPASGERCVLVDRTKANASLKEHLGEEAWTEKEEDADGELPGWPDAFDLNGRWALYVFADDLFLLDLVASSFRRLTTTPEEEKVPRFSPDGKRIAFVRSNNLYVYDIELETETQLTKTGTETLLNGTLTWVYWEEIFGREDLGYWWSDDSTALAFFETDESPVGVMHFPDFKPNTPRVIKQRYPKSGEANPRVRVGIIELTETPKTRWIDLGVYPYEYLARVQWLPDSQQLAVQTLDRAQRTLDLFLADRASGKVSHLLRETDPGWINIHDDLWFLEKTERFLWASERDGFYHLYLYNNDGTLIRQITRGEWALRSSGGPFWMRRTVVSVDEGTETLYFTALEKSSVEKHLYRIGFDGSGMERLSKERGTHRVRFSPNGKLYFDRYSNVATLPSLKLYNRDGGLQATLAEPRPELLEDYGMRYPELFTIPTSDDFPMPAHILKPADFDPEKKYPVIIYVYGGPSAPTVADSWPRGIYFNQMLLDAGYLVLQVDNRSATAISKKLENTILHQAWGAKELADFLDAVKWLKSQSWVDPDRVGVWGWSGGGTMTILSMTGSKEFKAGIAVAAVTDWDYYDTKWTESFMKRQEDNPEGYENTSLVEKAGELHGRILLVHGTYDDNVHIQNLWAFVDRLIEEGKLYEMLVYPMRKHGIADDPARIHLYRSMLEFWKRSL